VDERLDDALDGAADSELDGDMDAALDQNLDEDLDEELDGDAEAVGSESKGRGAKRAPGKDARPTKAGPGRKSTRGKGKDADRRPGVFARIRNFVREVVAELRKVIWPTRKELLTYTAVVIVFVTIMFSVVALFDLGFAKAMFWVFGNTKKNG